MCNLCIYYLLKLYDLIKVFEFEFEFEFYRGSFEPLWFMVADKPQKISNEPR